MLASHAEDVDWEQEQERDERERAGWTMVSEEPDGPASEEDDQSSVLDASLIESLREPAVFNADDESEDETAKEGKDAIKSDIDEIVKGTCFWARSLLRVE